MTPPVIGGVESLLNGVIARINAFIGRVNDVLAKLPDWAQGDWSKIDPVGKLAAGVYIWSDSTAIPALDMGGSFLGGLTLINKGFIMGKGGDGGYRAAARSDWRIQAAQTDRLGSVVPPAAALCSSSIFGLP